MPKKPQWSPDRHTPARSGAHTPRSSEVVRHGGKVDPDALLKRIHAAQAGGDDPDAADLALTLPDDPEQAAQTSTDSAEDDAPNRVVFVLQRDLDKRLDKYLCDRIPFMSRSQLQRLIDEGGVTVNARAPKSSTKLRAGDRVEVYVPPPPPTDVQPEDIPLGVLYEDEQLVVINKSPDIIVHPARSHNSGTMINALAFHFQNRSAGALSSVGKDFARPGVVHRLDRQTSGLIIFAKTDEAHWRLGQQFERRTVDKRYLAIVHGVYEPPVDPIDLPLGPHPSREKGYREKYVVRHDHLGKSTLTIARVRRQFRVGDAAVAAPIEHGTPGVSEITPPDSIGWKPALRAAAEPGYSKPASRHGVPAGFSLVELELKTGRTHQIRVHLTHRGFPILGDDMYGGKALYTSDRDGEPASLDAPRHLEPGQSASPEETVINRQALHATTLSFRHPTDNRAMHFVAPLPTDMRRAIAAFSSMDPGAALLHPPGSAVDVDSVLRED